MRFYRDASEYRNPSTDRFVLPKIFAQGSSRSSKTYNFIKTIITFADANRDKPLFVAVLRSTLDSARENTFRDFIECFGVVGLEEGVDYTQKSNPKPQINLWGTTIAFYGLTDTNTASSTGGKREAPRSDICYVNEIIENGSFDLIESWMMRCEMLFMADFNPSKLSHVVYDYAKRENTVYFKVSYLNNPYLSDIQVSYIEGLCPWDFSDSEIRYDEFGLAYRQWLVPESQRKVNELNAESGTIDRYKWMVYGEGVPTAPEGVVYDVTHIDEFPSEVDDVVFGLDFGYSADPSALVRVGRDGRDLFVKYEAYQRTPDPDTLYELIKPTLKAYQVELMRELAQAGERSDEVPFVTVVCESADRYKDTEFVRDLNLLSNVYNDHFQFVKVKKPKIVARIAFMKKFNIYAVRSAKTDKGDYQSENEFDGYVYSKQNGIVTNLPIDKNNHGINAMEYAVWYSYRWVAQE